MNITGSLRGLVRRWYITVPGIILAIAVALAAWFFVPAENQRTASLLLVPGQGSLPAQASNPYLYLAGLATATDVVARAAGAADSLAEILAAHPDAEVTLVRDASTSGPIILITVTTTTDAETAEVLEKVIEHTGQTLSTLQSGEGIAQKDRITMVTLAADEQSTLRQRTRIAVSLGAGAGVLLLSFVVAASVDGLARRRSRSEIWAGSEQDADDADDLDGADDSDDSDEDYSGETEAEEVTEALEPEAEWDDLTGSDDDARDESERVPQLPQQRR